MVFGHHSVRFALARQRAFLFLVDVVVRDERPARLHTQQRNQLDPTLGVPSGGWLHGASRPPPHRADNSTLRRPHITSPRTPPSAIAEETPVSLVIGERETVQTTWLDALLTAPAPSDDRTFRALNYPARRQPRQSPLDSSSDELRLSWGTLA
uniref:Uncharacterized protein n=1 Tax=Knipowitschia caucasica TaxID=637954 RepID=A0AAV2K6V4_KNICA